MKIYATAIGLVFVFGISTTAMAQFPTATKEHKVLKLEEGEWNAAVTMYAGPAGLYDQPHKSKAKESSRMIGSFWIVSDFSGEFEGIKLTGRAQFGYDAKKKKYVGTWIDSFSPNPTKMVGTYDADKRTMTYETSTVGMDGSPSKGKNVVVYGDGKKVMTMYAAAPGTDEMIKVMEIVYTQAK